MNVEHHRSGDREPVHVTRDIPLAWLIGVVVGLIVQAVTLYSGQQTQSESIRALITEVKELRILVQNGSIKDVEYGLRLDDHERRMMVLESHAPARSARPDAKDTNETNHK